MEGRGEKGDEEGEHACVRMGGREGGSDRFEANQTAFFVQFLYLVMHGVCVGELV